MRAPGPRWLLPALLLCLAAFPLRAQGVLTGTIRDDSTGRPLAAAEVLIQALGRRTMTDQGGRYVLGALPPGFRQVLVRLVGYYPTGAMVQLTGADTVRLDFALLESVVELEPIEVTGQPKAPRGIGREAFEERRRMGFGRFVDSTELRRSEHLRLHDVLRRQGIHAEPMRVAGRPGYVAVSSWQRCQNGRLCCFMQVILDGIVLYRAQASAGGTGFLVDLNDFVVSSLESVEVYRSAAETPAEFAGTGGACGTIVLWTRRGP